MRCLDFRDCSPRFWFVYRTVKGNVLWLSRHNHWFQIRQEKVGGFYCLRICLTERIVLEGVRSSKQDGIIIYKWRSTQERGREVEGYWIQCRGRVIKWSKWDCELHWLIDRIINDKDDCGVWLSNSSLRICNKL